MAALKRFDIAGFGDQLMVVVESELLPPDPAIVVIPLIEEYPVIRHLNPIIEYEGRPLVLATRLITSVRRAALAHRGSAVQARDQITRAVDILMAGV